MTKICIILPAYNEELTIKNVIESFHYEEPYDIWIVDNNSTDNTNNIAVQTLKKLNNQGGVLFEEKPGKGNAVRKAFINLNYDIYVMCDADMTYPADRLKDLIDPIINNNVDMVVGVRMSSYHVENKRRFHSFGNKLVLFLINKLFKSKLNDVMSGYRVFSKRFINAYPFLTDSFELETDMSIFALDNKYSIKEIDIDYKDRPAGSISKLNTIKDGFLVLLTIFNLFRFNKPLIFFSIISIILFIFGLVSGYPVINEYLKTAYISRVPLAVLTVLFILASFVFLITGLILDSIPFHHKHLSNKRKI